LLNLKGIIPPLVTPFDDDGSIRYDLEGYRAGLPRQPLLPLKPAQREDLEQTFRRMNSELSEIS
jgi:dihydrodipicolinate synthase/N-acetylneuraminate lyase